MFTHFPLYRSNQRGGSSAGKCDTALPNLPKLNSNLPLVRVDMGLLESRNDDEGTSNVGTKYITASDTCM